MAGSRRVDITGGQPNVKIIGAPVLSSPTTTPGRWASHAEVLLTSPMRACCRRGAAQGRPVAMGRVVAGSGPAGEAREAAKDHWVCRHDLLRERGVAVDRPGPIAHADERARHSLAPLLRRADHPRVLDQREPLGRGRASPERYRDVSKRSSRHARPATSTALWKTRPCTASRRRRHRARHPVADAKQQELASVAPGCGGGRRRVASRMPGWAGTVFEDARP